MEFPRMVHILWHFYIHNTSVQDVALYLMSRHCFQLHEVCLATVEYWFQRFSSNFHYTRDKRITESTNIYLRIECLKALQILHPSWTAYHYMDALKVPKELAEWYLKKILRSRRDQQ
ncbi:hypothetical protein M0802_015224 [Mischocyttarus mexicanus]|nr:hypothetical protein M0802_015224 [Mischocyttarus mexicanus]